MGKVIQLYDNLRNALTGAGTSRDARMQSAYSFTGLTQHQIDAAYRGSGLMRKIIQIPAQDMVREWRDWKLEADEVAAVESEERRLSITQKVRAVEVLRGLGGGALILGLPGQPDQPAPPTVSVGGLAYVHVVSRWHLSFDQLEDDARLPGYGEPPMWRMATTSGQITLHPSRVIPFRADTTASLASVQTNSADAFWGESTVAQVLDAVQDSDTARGAFASMLHKARTLRVGIPGLMSMIASGQKADIQERMAILSLAESMHNAVVYDAGVEGKGGETITDAQYNFAGAKDIMSALWEFVAAISDIPATRLLGRAPEGMNSSGDSQQKDWNKRVKAAQELDLGPCIDRLDCYLIPSALGKSPDKSAWYEWSALDTPSEKETAERLKVIGDLAKVVSDMQIMPDRALNRGLQSWLVNEGVFPELESALAEIPDDERYGIEGSDLDMTGEGLEAEGV
jgi:uncharacterized protein